MGYVHGELAVTFNEQTWPIFEELTEIYLDNFEKKVKS
jgi:hypothetical protein